MQPSAQLPLVRYHLVKCCGKGLDELENFVSWLKAGQSLLDPRSNLSCQGIGSDMSSFCWLRRTGVLFTLYPDSLGGVLAQMAAIDSIRVDSVLDSVFAPVVASQVLVNAACLERCLTRVLEVYR